MKAVLPIVGLTAVVVAWGLAGIGGTPADCIPACDCEAIGTGTIRQPAAAWSSLAITAAGIWAASRGSARALVLGYGVAFAGLAAFATHASAAGWAYRLDGAAVVLVVWLVAGTEAAPSRIAVPGAVAIAAPAMWIGAPGSGWLAAAGAAVFLGARARSGDWIAPAPGAAVLGAGLLVRALTDDGGPWCRPGAPFPGHAFWHLIAAAGLAMLAAGLDGAGTRSLGAALRSGGVRDDDAQG